MDHDRPALATYEELAQRMDHLLVHPTLTEDQLRDGCLMAIEYDVASVTVRPCDLDIALRVVRGTKVALGSVVGFPHGTQNTATKLYEARDLIRRGAKYLDVVINVSKLIARQWIYVETELLQLSQNAREEGVTLHVILETPVLPEEQKIVACRIAKRAAPAGVCAASGYAGPFSEPDIELLVRKCDGYLNIKASPVDSLDAVIHLHALGATRFGSRHTEAILQAWKTRLEQQQTKSIAVS